MFKNKILKKNQSIAQSELSSVENNVKIYVLIDEKDIIVYKPEKAQEKTSNVEIS